MGSAAAFYVMRFSVSVVEHVLQLFEEALALFVVFFFQGALELLQGLPLGLVQLLGDLHLALDVHITAAAAIQVLDALAAQAEVVPLWVPSGTVYSTLPSMEGTCTVSPSTA